MADPKEVNLATKQSLDLFFSDGIGPDAYLKPPTTVEEMQANGLMDQEGNATSKGFLFTVLQEAGAIDERGVLTEKARAYAVSPRDLQSPDNLWAFKQQWKDGILDGADQTFTETAGNVADFTMDAVSGLANHTWQQIQTRFHRAKSIKGILRLEDNRPEKLKREMDATQTGLIEGATQAAAQTGTTAFMLSAWLGDKIHDTLGTGLEDEAEEMLWTARQKQWSLNQDIQALEAGETAEAVLGMADAVETVAQAKEQLGEEEFQNTYGKALAAGQLFGSPENIATMLVSGGAATAPTLATRWGLRAQNALGKVAQLDAKIASAEVALAKANNVIAKQSVWAAKPETAALAGRLAADAQAAIPRLSDDLAKLTAQRTALATKIPETAAQAFQKTIELGRQVKAAPANIMGGTLERIGSTMQRIDSGIAEGLKSRGLDQLYTFGVGAASMAGLGGNPVFGAIAAGAGFLKMGGRIEQFGKLSKYVGKEMMKARGQVPFWKRVANHTQPGTLNSALAHAFNYADLAGVSSDILRRGARGVAAAAPMDLAFEFIAEGADMDRKTIQQSLAESLVLGGSTAALGGIAMGTKRRMRENAILDELNFRETLVDTDQKAIFQALPPSERRAIGTFSMANPNANFDFTNRGGGAYDPATNTIIIDVNSKNRLKALIAHEVLHHVTIKNQMEPGIAALFLGDTKGNTTGGLLRSKDGTLDPNFKSFVDAYNNRMAQAGMESPSLETLAVEYFIEQHADQYADMAESGELGAMASRTALGNKMRDIVNAILPKAPVLKDLHFKMGGQMDASGAMVMGNGLLAEGIRQLPAAQRMFRDMNRRSAGSAEGQFTPLGTSKKDKGGVSITLDPNNPIDLELLHPIMEKGPDGKPRPIDKATDLARSRAGIALMEALRDKQRKGRMPEQGEMHIAPDGTVKGNWISDDTLKTIVNAGKLNKDQIQNLKVINNVIKAGEGGRTVMIYFPALETTPRGKKIYKAKAATLRDTVPVSLTVDPKTGNILVGLMSVTQLTENITKRAQSKRGKQLYGGNIGAITEDVREMMRFHKEGVDSIEYFQKKYGAVEADTRKKFINTLFGLMNKSEQAVLNPMLLEDGVKSDSNVYRTYRLDRISKAVPLDPTQYKPMTFVYEAAKTVKMPEPLKNNGQTVGNSGESLREGRPEDSQIPLREPQNVGGGNEKTTGIIQPLEGFGRPVLEKPWVREERSSFADIDREEAELAEWAATNGWTMDVPAVQAIRGKGYETRRGNEHDVVFAPDGVYRFTNGDKYGMEYRTPSEYLARWAKSNKLFPDAAVEFVGFYQKPSGVGVIVTRQPFIKGKRGTAKQIEAAMAKRGFTPYGNYSFRNQETGIEVYDAHEDNVLFDAKGNIMPFDVWVNDPNNILSISQ